MKKFYYFGACSADPYGSGSALFAYLSVLALRLNLVRVLDKMEMIIRVIFLFILHKNICYEPSSQPSRRDGSDAGSQHMVSVRNKKNKVIPQLSSNNPS